MPDLYILSQIRAALGKRKDSHLRDRMPPPSGKRMVRGKFVEAWEESKLPPSIIAELQRNAALHRCRSVAMLLRIADAKLQLYEHPFTPHLEEIAAAQRRCKIIGDLLVEHGRDKFATVLRKANVGFTSEANLPTKQTVSNWIKEAIKRDGGWLRFHREELYYSRTRRSATVAESEPLARHSPQPDEPRGRAALWDAARRWHLAFAEYERHLACKVPEKTARHNAIRDLTLPDSPLFEAADDPKARDRQRKAFAYSLKKWRDGGRCWKALLHASEVESPLPCKTKKPRIVLNADELACLKYFILKKDSFDLGIECFIDAAPADKLRNQTRAALQAIIDRARSGPKILRPRWPDSLRQQAHIMAEVRAKFRGRKASQAIEFSSRRSMTWVDESGVTRPMRPNIIWESDDMSANEAFTWGEEGPTGERERRIGRQTLFTMDVFSCFWLGVSPIGRERDAYRAEDIADHMLECVLANGLPHIWRLERGPWENNFIDGINIAGREERWGGLDEIVHIQRAWKSKQKGTIESSFDLLQSFLAHESTSIGRHRGEFEQQTKLFLAAGRGDQDAWGRFWPISEAADGILEAMRKFNKRPKKRDAFGSGLVIPQELYRNFERIELKLEDAWRFCPVKREATVRNGQIKCHVKDYGLPFIFTVNGVDESVHLEQGYQVLIAFHPGHPERGCHVFNGETAARNKYGFAFGERIFAQPVALAAFAPQVDLSLAERRSLAKPGRNAAMRAEFRAIGSSGEPARRSSVQRNGLGDSVAIEQGGGSHSFAIPTDRADQSPDVRARSEELVAAARQREEDEEEALYLSVLKKQEEAIAEGYLTPIK